MRISLRLEVEAGNARPARFTPADHAAAFAVAILQWLYRPSNQVGKRRVFLPEARPSRSPESTHGDKVARRGRQVHCRPGREGGRKRVTVRSRRGALRVAVSKRSLMRKQGKMREEGKVVRESRKSPRAMSCACVRAERRLAKLCPLISFTAQWPYAAGVRWSEGAEARMSS